MKKQFSAGLTLLGVLLALVFVNILSHFFYFRADLTHDKRYTLSATTLQIVNAVQEPLHIEVFLEGDFPAEFRKLQEETQQFTQELTARNNNIYVSFTNPLSDEANAKELSAELFAQGMKPLSVNVNDKGKQTQEMAFPWAKVTYQDKVAIVPLIKNSMGQSIEDKINVSVQYFEYVFADALKKVTVPKTKKIAIIKGIGEMPDQYIADFLLTLRESYFIAPFTLDSVATAPEKALKELQTYDLALIIKPTQAFSESSLQVLDQYIMSGGKSFWMIDRVQAEMDSLYQPEGALAYPKEVGDLDQMFFRYGLRINPVLIKDELGTPLKLAVGKQGSETVYDNFIWKFAPYIVPTTQHPIVANVDGMKFDFPSVIDTLKNKVKKTVLLKSSPYSMAVGTPLPIKLEMLNDNTPADAYQGKGELPVALLLEGELTSMYKNRVLPFKQANFLAQSTPTQMIVVADGDLVRNQLDQNRNPLETGFDKWTNTLYGNKEFALNAVNYLLDDSGLINIRTKEIKLPLLNKEKVYTDYTKLQAITVGIPIVLLIVVGVFFVYWRRKKYSK